MDPFLVFMVWVFGCWVIIRLTEHPLQPDQPEDGLAPVDLTDVHRQRAIRESTWWESPQVNVVLSRRRGRG